MSGIKGKFIFKTYDFDKNSFVASFRYGFENGPSFIESVSFSKGDLGYDSKVLDTVMRLAFVTIGVSYYKAYPSVEVDLGSLVIDSWQADFFNHVYQEGLGQFAFENNLARSDLAHFEANSEGQDLYAPIEYSGNGVLSLQSGGKDSLLTATLLEEKGEDFVSWYVSTGEYHPALLDGLGSALATSVRTIDKDALRAAADDGAKNGHVPVTYIVQTMALIQAVLLGKNRVLTSIAHEGEEPHHQIGDLAITHQWSKTWGAEQAFAEYVNRYISHDIKIGSPLRGYSELLVAQMFIEHSWEKYGHLFSSCNRANYIQGHENTVLSWCGDCPKCANSYLLFSPFLPAEELKSIFGGVDLYTKTSLTETFKGLLGVEGVPKPFECIGEIDELRKAYWMAQDKGGYSPLPFDVPKSSFDYKKEYPAQHWAVEMLK